MSSQSRSNDPGSGLVPAILVRASGKNLAFLPRIPEALFYAIFSIAETRSVSDTAESTRGGGG